MAVSRSLLTLAISAALAGNVVGQSVRGTVVSSGDGAPIVAAAVSAIVARAGATTDRFGRFTIATATVDTLVIAAIGWSPDTVAVTGSDPIVVRLERAPFIVSDLIARAPAVAPPRVNDLARWSMPIAAARSVPPAVETDVYRALALIPGITFSSPLSARPMLRGYDAQDVATRIDGFEILNLYHLGRIFSSFPADAAETITVSAPPYGADQGGSVGGIIDIEGRTGSTDRLRFGGGLSYGSLSGYLGGGGEQARFFATGRLFYWKSLDLIPSVRIPYRFEDLYAGIVLGPTKRPSGRVTLFATEDRAGKPSERRFLDWDNLLIAGRQRVVDRGRVTAELSASLASYRQRGENVPGLHTVTNADLSNLFRRALGTMDVAVTGTTTRFAGGASVGWRRVENRISDAATGIGFDDRSRSPRAALTVDRAELGGYLEAATRLRAVTIEGSVRLDAAGSLVSLQPRGRIRWTARPGLAVGVGAGRTSRLYHLLSEPQSEPDFDFLDFWLAAGDTIPAARVDHLTVDVDADLGPVAARVSSYVSRGTGVGELRPEVDQHPTGPEFFRFGESRTAGVEVQVAFRGTAQSPQSASLSYAFAKSERRWGDRWVRWTLDRRHQLRGFGQVRRRGLTLFGAVELAGGAPITPVDRQLIPAATGLPVAERPVDQFGREGSGTTAGTFRVDGGLSYRFGGPERNRFTLGVSVINLLGTAVAPFALARSANGADAVDSAGRPLPYRRLFELPPIPTITLRAEF